MRALVLSLSANRLRRYKSCMPRNDGSAAWRVAARERSDGGIPILPALAFSVGDASGRRHVYEKGLQTNAREVANGIVWQVSSAARWRMSSSPGI